MQLKKTGRNSHLLFLPKKNVVFFAFDEPVAAYLGGVFYRSSEEQAGAVEKLISYWSDKVDVVTFSPSEFKREVDAAVTTCVCER